jgi:hypothetical protein
MGESGYGRSAPGHCGRVEHAYTRERSGHLVVRVKIAIDPLTQRSVSVSPNAFSQTGDEANEQYHRAVMSGAMSALNDAETGGCWRHNYLVT